MDARNYVLDNLIYQTISGSRSYGTNTPASDEDTLGVFMPHPENMLGVGSNLEHYRGSETDENYKSINTFFQHVVDGSSYWIEPFFVRAEDILCFHECFRPFVENREMFLNKRLIHKSKGFMDGMLKRSQSQKGVGDKSLSPEDAEAALLKVKRGNMCHAIRVGRMILEMFDTRKLQVYRTTKEEQDYLRGIKSGAVSLEDTWTECEELFVKINEKELVTNLPDRVDEEILNKMLVKCITTYWKDKGWI